MNEEMLFLFVILLLALILCTYLGGADCVNKRIEGMTGVNSNTYVADNGATARIVSGPNGTTVLTVTDKDGNSNAYSTASGGDVNTYYASNGNGGSATLTTNSNGSAVLTVTTQDGTKTVFTVQNDNGSTTTSSTSTSSTSSYDNYNHYTGNSHASIYYGPDGGTAKIIDNGSDGTIVITRKDGTTEIYYIDNNNSNTTTYVGPNGGTAKMITDSNGKSAVEITGPNGSKIVYTEDNTYTYNSNTGDVDQYSHYNGYNNNGYNNVDTNTYYGPNGQVNTVTGPNGNTAVNADPNAYYNSLPAGVSRNQIPAGQEDLYILKSQVVPPVCPKCPDPILKCDGDASQCQPCPAPMRCPEPAFDCKKSRTTKHSTKITCQSQF
jgi:hypothetical protein